MNERIVLEILKQKHDPNQWAFFTHVPSGTGSYKNRTADAMAFNLWPSRGLEVHGFEVKVSRSDFLGELKKPEKSAEIQKFCDRWWVATPKDIIRDGELPPTWGHIVVTDKTSRIIVQAPKLSSIPADAEFIAALMRTVQNHKETSEELQAKLKVEYDRGHKNGLQSNDAHYALENYNALLAKVRKFEAEEGVSIQHEWKRTPGLFKAFCSINDKETLIELMKRSRDKAQTLVKIIDDQLHSIDGSS